MTQFKFFRGYIGTLDIMDGQTYATASLHHPRLDSNNEMERWFAERDLQTISQEQYNLNRDAAAEQGERLHRDLNDNPIRLFQATRVTTVNPKFWTKVKIVLQESWRLEPIGVVVVSILLTMVTIIGIAKILSIW